jgi:signal transduction histidine kinase
MDARELEAKAEMARLLLGVARELGETLEPDRVYDRFRELLADVVPNDGIVVSSYEEAEGLIRCEYAWVGGNRLDPAILPPLPLNREGRGMQSRVITTGEPLLVNDVEERVQEHGGTYYDVDPQGTVRKLPDSGPSGTQAALMVPVKHESRVVGVVQVMRDEGRYTAEQLELVEGLVGQMAAAVRNARLQKERARLLAAEAAALAVAAEREQAAHVLEAVGDGIFLVDGEGVVRFWNHAAELVTGIAADDARGRRIAEVLTGWDALAARISVAAGGAAPDPATLPVTVAERELWLSFVAVRGAAGDVYAFRDLTAERRLDEEKSDFIATISHELRTPMAAVYGAAETLLREDIEVPADVQRKLAQMIASQASRLTNIVNELLLARRLDRGEVQFEREAVDVAELSRTTIEAMRTQLPDDVAVEIDVADGVDRAAGDPARIQQVLVNLVDNAVKYGGSDVRVRVEQGQEAVRILVTDSGPGIEPAEQQRIFEKFYRVDPQLRRSPGGTGLGLYISRELVDRMGGRLTVSSRPAAGATFVLELPRTQNQHPATS